MIFWTLIALLVFVAIVRFAKAILFKKEARAERVGDLLVVQKAIAESIKIKSERFHLGAEEIDDVNQAGKKIRKITVTVEEADEILDLFDVVLRDILRWCNVVGLACSGVTIRVLALETLHAQISDIFEGKVLGNKRILEMKRLGANFHLHVEASRDL